MKRFFYSGCSFTSYLYPTWGDIIAHDKLKYKGYDFALNLGIPGGCNQLIASRLALADKKYKFTDQDDIAILWTTLFRESVLTTWFDEPHTRWHAHGNSFNSPFWSKISNQEYFHNAYNMLERNMNTLHYVSKLYKPFYQGIIAYGYGYQHENDFEELISNDVANPLIYSSHHDLLKNFHAEYYSLHRFSMPDTYKRSDELFLKIFDMHPDINDHLAHAQKVTDLDSRTVMYYKNLSNDIQKLIDDNQHLKNDFHNFKQYLIDTKLFRDLNLSDSEKYIYDKY